MRILHVVPAYDPAWELGGVVRSVSCLCRGLARLGFNVTVFTTDSARNRRLSIPINCLVEVDGVRVFYFKTDLSLKFAYSRSLREACRQYINDFDIIHLTSFWCYPEIPATAAAIEYKVPYLISVRGTLRKSALQQKALKKWCYFNIVEKGIIKKAAALHYTSQLERELDSIHKFVIPSFLVPNGFERGEFNILENKREARKYWNIVETSKVITFLGRLHPVKRLDLLIKAMVIQGLNKKDVVLLIAGPDDGIEKSLRHLVNSLGLEERVRFLGLVAPQDRNRLLVASDIVALISADENFGNAAVEAMFAGVPVLLTEHVGICREVMADGGGKVVPLQMEAIAHTLEEMLSDLTRLRAMGRVAAVTSRKRYDIDLVARQMAMAYEDILTGQRSPELSWSDGQKNSH